MEGRLEALGVKIVDDDGSFGPYAHGGVLWRLGSRFNVGADVRLFRAGDADLFGDEGKVEYRQLALVLGWGWPARS